MVISSRGLCPSDAISRLLGFQRERPRRGRRHSGLQAGRWAAKSLQPGRGGQKGHASPRAWGRQDARLSQALRACVCAAAIVTGYCHIAHSPCPCHTDPHFRPEVTAISHQRLSDWPARQDLGAFSLILVPFVLNGRLGVGHRLTSTFGQKPWPVTCAVTGARESCAHRGC